MARRDDMPTDICGRCGHDRDTHWWSGFVCQDCGCTLFKNTTLKVGAK